MNEDLVANGFCEDISNTPSCNYDGGDCCGFDVITDYCYFCQCVIDELGAFGIGNDAENVNSENELLCKQFLNTGRCLVRSAWKNEKLLEFPLS